MAEKILLVCSSTAANLLKAEEILSTRPIFHHPELHILCSLRDLPAVKAMQSARQVWVFPHRRDLRNGFGFWLRILKQRYDVVVVLWCLDQARLRQKLFALACGTCRIVVFNENLDCAYLSLSFLSRFLAARFRDGHLTGGLVGRSLWVTLERGTRTFLRILLFPIRLIILVGAVLVLYGGKKSSRRSRKDST